MDIFLLIISGFISGLLVFMLDYNQHLAQAINLLAFMPTSVLSLTVHIKNKFLKIKKVWYLLIIMPLSSLGFSFLAKYINGNILQICFGAMLLFIGVLMLRPKPKERKTS